MAVCRFEDQNQQTLTFLGTHQELGPGLETTLMAIKGGSLTRLISELKSQGRLI